MTAPKRIWVNVYSDSDNHSAWETSEHARDKRLPGATTHEYRLVAPKREPLAYIVKKGDLYADGDRGWVKDIFRAFRFGESNYGARPGRWREGAHQHARTFVGARVVRLVRKERP